MIDNWYMFRGIKYVKAFLVLSISISVFSISYYKLQLGQDFTGGGIVTVSKNLSKEKASMLSVSNYISYINENEVFFNSKTYDDFKGDLGLFSKSIENNGIKVIKSDFIGSKFGVNTLINVCYAVFFAFLSIWIYMLVKFSCKMSNLAVIAIAYNCLVTLGFMAFFGIKIDIVVISGVLIIIGYSVNDTVVVFDRIKVVLIENKQELITKTIAKDALQKVLKRSLKTSIVTFLGVFPLAIFGAKDIQNLAIVVLIGIVFGTFASIVIIPVFLDFINIKMKQRVENKNVDPMKYV